MSREWSRYVMSGNSYPRNDPAYCMCPVCEEVYAYHNNGSTCRCNGCNSRYSAANPAPITLSELYPTEMKGRESSMAMVALCDRCGHMGLSTTFGTLMWRFTDNDQQTAKNVCPGCVGEFWAFISGKGGERPPEPYREPFRIVEDKPEESDRESLMDALANSLLERLNRSKAIESGKTIRVEDE